MTIAYRKAVPGDTPACILLRGMTRENAFSVEQLAERGITLESWRDAIADGSLPGHLATEDGKIVGYCFAHADSGEIAVLALLPSHEGKGIGRKLLALMVEDLRQRGLTRLFLGCSTDPEVRSYGFYRHLGWRSTGSFDEAGDEVLEYTLH
jgi:N-acetylglutamate synthase-like GNAT family acetyltransferase